MTNPRPFARILIAADGEQVLFVVDKFDGMERLQAVTRTAEGLLVTHTLSFDKEGMALQLLEACEQEQADIMRRFALEGQGGAMASMLGSVGMMQ